MLVITYRPRRRRYTPRWIESAHVTTMTLTGLPQQQGAELVGNVAQGKALPAEVLEQIVARADGVPLYHRGTDQVGAGIATAARRGRSLHPARAAARLAIPTTLEARRSSRAWVAAKASRAGPDRRVHRARVLLRAAGRGRAKRGRELRRGARAADARPDWCSGAARRRMPPTPSSMRWCRTRPTTRCSSSKRQQLHAADRGRLGERVSAARRQRAGAAGPSPHRGRPSDRGDPALAQSWRVCARTGRAAGGGRRTSKRDWLTSSGCRRPPSATTSSFRSGSRCTRRGFDGAAGQRQRWASNARRSCGWRSDSVSRRVC